ncbi:MAG: flagellar basal body rod protein FlgB [Eubacterium sp.]|nr:flagellar basal body rod protein FlgB [Eubacterium sp.]
MIDTSIFKYIDVLDKAADASWLKNDALANNIANVDTPGYNRQDVNFEDALQSALMKNSYVSLDEKIDNLDWDRLDVGVYTEYTSYSYRLDENNVDIDTENVKLAENQLVYQGLTNSISEELNRLKSVCT